MDVAPPRDEDELMTRARALAGLRVGELARRLKQWVPADPRKSKGAAGQLAERALGATAGSLDEPDFLELGIELKTLPVAESGAPKESTYVCTLPLQTLHDVDFEDSAVFRKLRRVLWLPIEAASETPLVDRHYGSAFLWSPSPNELEVLRADYEAVAEKVIAGRVDEVRGELGVALQVRPKAANGRQRTLAPDGDEGFVWTGPRGFYLRPSFTGGLLARAFG